jgi:hypothetical protein
MLIEGIVIPAKVLFCSWDVSFVTGNTLIHGGTAKEQSKLLGLLMLRGAI